MELLKSLEENDMVTYLVENIKIFIKKITLLPFSVRTVHNIEDIPHDVRMLECTQGKNYVVYLRYV